LPDSIYYDENTEWKEGFLMDEKLLSLLEKNAQLTCAQLAMMLDRPEAEIAAEIKKLEAEGVICGYKAVIDWEKAGREYIQAFIDIKVSPKRDLGFEDIARKVMSFPEVESVYLMSGGYDLSVTISGKSFKDVALFVAHRLAPLDSVLSTATHFVLRRYKEGGVEFAIAEDEDDRELVSP